MVVEAAAPWLRSWTDGCSGGPTHDTDGRGCPFPPDFAGQTACPKRETVARKWPLCPPADTCEFPLGFLRPHTQAFAQGLRSRVRSARATAPSGAGSAAKNPRCGLDFQRSPPAVSLRSLLWVFSWLRRRLGRSLTVMVLRGQTAGKLNWRRCPIAI